MLQLWTSGSTSGERRQPNPLERNRAEHSTRRTTVPENEVMAPHVSGADRTKYFSRVRRASLLVLVSLLTAACPSPPPPAPVTPGPMTGSVAGPGDNYSVTVIAAGPPTWVYRLTSVYLWPPPATTGYFSAVEMHSTCPGFDRAKVTVLREVPGAVSFGGPAATTIPGYAILWPAPSDVRIQAGGAAPATPLPGWSELSIQVDVDCRNGSVNFLFDDRTPIVSPPIRMVVGPVAGPE